MLNVFITVDTETWPDALDTRGGAFARAFRRDIYGASPRGDYGLPLQLEMLRDHGLHATFFVESLFASAVGREPLSEIVGLVQGAGQEVQLHLHAEWARTLPAPAAPRRRKVNLWSFSEGEQLALLERGVANLRSAGVERISAFRAGNYGADAATLRALARLGVAFDTSYNYCYLDRDCALRTERPLLQSSPIQGVTEVPINFFRDWPGHFRHTQLSACSFRELEGLLMQAWERGWTSFVIVSHSFELLGPARSGPDPVMARRFEKLCRLLAAHPDRFRTRGFDDLRPEELIRPAHGGSLVSPVWRTAERIGSQLSRRTARRARELAGLTGPPELPAPRPAAPGADSWSVRAVRMKYAVGDRLLYEDRLWLREWQGPFDQLPPGDESLARSGLSPNRWVDGALVRSQPTTRQLPRIRICDDCVVYVPRQYNRYFIDLRGAFSDYQAKFSSKSRSTMRRKVRRLRDALGGILDWREYRTPQELDEFARLARCLSDKTYQARLLGAGLPDSPAFWERARRLARRDAVRAYLLLAWGRPIAYLYCPIADGVLVYRYLGYDPAYAKHSPGSVLQWLVIERLFAEGCHRMFDFTEGEGAHKEFFATGSVRCADIYVLKRTPRNLLRVSAHAGMSYATRRVANGLDRLRLKPWLKELLRRVG